MYSIDTAVQDYFVSSRTPGVTDFLFPITTIFNLSFSFATIILLLGILVYRIKGIRYSYLFFGTILFSTISVYVLKYIFGIARPSDSFFIEQGASLPSGHATISTVLLILINYIFFRSFGEIYRRSLAILSAGMVLLVSLSRMYFGVHWLSDVVFGVVLGVIISYISIRIFKWY
jgi:membrane-associated phospholipid phosphatase